MKAKGKTIIAMSGGVDSCVAAALLKEHGHDLIGVTMRVWDLPDDADSRPGSCCSVDDANDARRVAEKLGIPHYTLNVKAEFKDRVVDYFVEEYMSGRTPNPCVICNQAIKFDYLFRQGEKFGASLVATGHYARVGKFRGHGVIMRGLDSGKDQSYFLFSVPPERIDSILFPLGGMSKPEARVLAEKYGFSVAEKPESQEICFVPDNDYGAMIEKTAGAGAVGEGDIVDTSGRTLGRHKGYPHYTVGQRRGLGVASAAPLYVTAIDPASNRVVVGGKDNVYGRALSAKDMNWFVPPEEAEGLDLTARIRSRGEEAPARIKPLEDGTLLVEFASPQLAITPGQAVVLYHGDVVVGGGWIEKRLD